MNPTPRQRWPPSPLVQAGSRVSGRDDDGTGTDDEARPLIPEIDVEACLLDTQPASRCQSCVDVCPSGAWLFDGIELTLDAGLCDGCRFCVPACPEAAIVMLRDGAISDPWRRSGETAHMTCEYREKAVGRAFAACPHAYGIRDVAELHENGIRRLVIDLGDCDTCERGGGLRLEKTVESFNALLADRGGSPVELAYGPFSGYGEDSPDLERRRFLRGSVRNITSNLLADGGLDPIRRVLRTRGDGTPVRRFLNVPRIDTALCNGCCVCARLCPHSALSEDSDGGGVALSVIPELCTGCKVCIDTCEETAIVVERMSVARNTWIPLRRLVCESCGAPFDFPEVRVDHDSVCPTCRRKEHPASPGRLAV